MSTCQTCGEEILWAKKADGTWSRPFEAMGLRLDAEHVVLERGEDGDLHIVSGDQINTLTMHRYHLCSRPQAYSLHRGDTPHENVKAKEDKESDRDRVLRFRYHTPRKKHILSNKCPHCDQALGEPCLAGYRSAFGIYANEPHPERGKLLPEVLARRLQGGRTFRRVRTVTQPLNRGEARWFGKTNRRWVADNGEVITARQHRQGNLDGIAVWKDLQSVGRSAGLIAWWEGGQRTTTDQLQYLYTSWDEAGRLDIKGGVNDGS